MKPDLFNKSIRAIISSAAFGILMIVFAILIATSETQSTAKAVVALTVIGTFFIVLAVLLVIRTVKREKEEEEIKYIETTENEISVKTKEGVSYIKPETEDSEGES